MLLLLSCVSAYFVAYLDSGAYNVTLSVMSYYTSILYAVTV
jgi:hypothetical protein